MNRIKETKKNNVAITQNCQEIIDKYNYYTPRHDDFCISPNEIINNKFSKKEREVIKSDPTFFKLNKSPFKNLHLLKNTTLIEQLSHEEDERQKQLLNIIKSEKERDQKESCVKMFQITKTKCLSKFNSDLVSNDEKSNNINNNSNECDKNTFKFKLKINKDNLFIPQEPANNNKNFKELSKNLNFKIPSLDNCRFKLINKVDKFDRGLQSIDFDFKMKIYSERRFSLIKKDMRCKLFINYLEKIAKDYDLSKLDF